MNQTQRTALPRRRILYQLVAPMEETLGVEEMERRRSFLERHAAPATTIDIRSVRQATASIESAYDAAIAVPAILESAREAVEDGCEAVIVGCFSDPGLDAAREILDVPVIGPGMSGIHLALQVGHRFSIISPNEARGGQSRAFIRQMGVEARYASTRGMGLTVVDLAKGEAAAEDRICEVGKACVEEDGADVIVLGCMSMAFLGLTPSLSRRIGVPVVSPVIAALKTAETMLAHGLAHSRAGWPAPPEKPVLVRGG